MRRGPSGPWRRATHTVLRHGGRWALNVAACLGLVSVLLASASVLFGLQPLILRSGSMEPSIDAGALALARSVPASQLVVGDVVSVTNPEGERLTHRVVAVEPGARAGAGPRTEILTLQGDANEQPDAQVHEVSEADRVFFDLPHLGRGVAWLQGWGGLVLVGAVAGGTLLRLRARGTAGDPAPRQGVAVTAVVVLLAGVMAPPLAGYQWSEASWNDTAQFEAGAIGAHRVQSFDWAAAPCAPGQNDQWVTLSHEVKDPRYDVIWRVNGQDLKSVALQGPRGTVVSTRVYYADLPSAMVQLGQVTLSGRSRLKNTPGWESQVDRRVALNVYNVLGLASGVQCADVSYPPKVVFSAPVDRANYPTEAAVRDATTAAGCPTSRAPCGTAVDAGGVRSVEFRLERVATGLGTRCWTGLVYTAAACESFRAADLTAPTNGGTQVRWSVPASVGVFTFPGTYTLDIRATDYAGEVAEATISVTRG